MKHRHHIIPKHAGGTDEKENIILLTVEEHANAHLLLYQTHHCHEDYVAWKALSGQFKKKELILELCKIGGKIQGKKNAESGHIQKIQKLVDVKTAGKIGGLETIKRGKGAFANAEMRLISSKNGGKIQGKKNAESGHCKNISIQYWKNVKNGSTIRLSKSWFYNPQNNHSILIIDGELPPDGYIKGRKIKK